MEKSNSDTEKLGGRSKTADNVKREQKSNGLNKVVRPYHRITNIANEHENEQTRT